MKKRHYIIDAYNYIHNKHSNFRTLDNLPKQRLEIINEEVNTIGDYCSANNCIVTLVFDGDNSGIGSPASTLDFKFSGKYIDADTVIKKMIDNLQVKNGTTIVSSDRQIMYYSKVSGVEYITSEDFAFMLDMQADSDGVDDFVDPKSFKYSSNASIGFAKSSTLAKDTLSDDRKSRGKSPKKDTKKKYVATEFYGDFSTELDDDEIQELLGTTKVIQNKNMNNLKEKNQDDKKAKAEEMHSNRMQKKDKTKMKKVDISQLGKIFKK